MKEPFLLFFLLQSILLGAGLAMDAFSVSVVNGLHDPEMPGRKMGLMAGTFAGFQFLMPVLGWLFVRFLSDTFTAAVPFIPWIGFLLLLYIGGSMILEGIRERKQVGEASPEVKKLAAGTLILQGIATSIDALSVGFAISDYTARQAVSAALIIALVTFLLCMIGVRFGRVIGKKISGGAQILGGVILILIGVEILIKSFL